MGNVKYISKTDFWKFMDILARDYDVCIPVKKGDQRFFRKYDGNSENAVIGEVRTFDPLKSFFTRAREIVAEGYSPDLPHSGDRPFAIVGAKACDLKGFKVQDYVYWDDDYKDSSYIKMREENLIISSDCTNSIDTCFCLAVDIQPFPKEDFDINLSETDEGFLAEAGSGKGESIISEHSSLFKEADANIVSMRDRKREMVANSVEKNIKENKIPHEDLLEGVIEKNYESDIWNKEAGKCVECGACTIICPTCHCFLLYDQKDDEKMARLRIWDSCMFKNYARVAGGENPRSRLWMRLRNRFEKKFDFFPKKKDIYACTGCGRCISACPAKIDIREVLKNLVKG